MESEEIKQTIFEKEAPANAREEARHWFALKVFYNRVPEIEEGLRELDMRTYVPMEPVAVERHGVKKIVQRPVVNSLLFFRGTTKQAIAVQREYYGRVMLYTRTVNETKRVPLMIPERQMNLFLLVSSKGEFGLEYFGEDHAKYHQGDLVRVTDGPFKGAEGHICRIKKDRRLVVAIDGVCAVATSYIPQCFLEKVTTQNTPVQHQSTDRID